MPCRDRTRFLSLFRDTRWGTAALLVALLVTPSAGSIYVVSSTNDDGAGSLRANINGANASPGSDTIIFAISGTGPHTIRPLSQLPTISDTLEINGYTQTGASPATASSPAVIMIELDGTLAGATSVGLDLFAPHCVIAGLCINQFGSHGIQIATYDYDVVVGNHIGTDVGGTLDRGNEGSGVYLYCADYAMIGHESPEGRNVIGGNDRFGIELEGNLGIRVVGTLIRANYIGMGANGASAVGNNLSGIYTLYTEGSMIGGMDDNHPNTIAFNGWDGIRVWDGFSYENAIIRNSIFANGLLGIDIYGDGVTANDAGDGDAGANQLQNYPVLSSATIGSGTTIIQGSLNSTASTQFRLEFFVNPLSDSTGYGEGQGWMGYSNQTTDGTGNVTFTANFPVIIPESTWVTATATDPVGNTSEFSHCVCARPPQFSAVVVLDELVMQWTPIPGAFEYWIFGAPGHAFFVPDLESMSNMVGVTPAGEETWSSGNGIGDPDLNWTYQVIAVDGGANEIARTNRLGEFDFGL